jgi:hypothetical protein
MFDQVSMRDIDVPAVPIRGLHKQELAYGDTSHNKRASAHLNKLQLFFKQSAVRVLFVRYHEVSMFGSDS